MTTQTLLKSVLKDIKPDQEAVLKVVNQFLRKIDAEIRAQKIKAAAVVGGSIAKDTNLAGDHDCDMFVKFDYKTYKDKDISRLLKKVLGKFKPVLLHGSRDYFQIENKINFEIVPVLDIEDPKDALNVTDMSPLHVGWVNRHPKLKDDIRLAKQFCKANGVYGAESYIMGFSGHVLDILTIHYKGFINLLTAASKWKYKEVIDPEDVYHGKALKELNRAKIDSAIIVIDPVLPERNAAAALSREKFDLFVAAAKSFIKAPSKEFFTIKTVDEDALRDKYGRGVMIFRAVPLKGKTDVIGAKLLKAFTAIKNRINFHDFAVKDAGWHWDKKGDALFWITTKRKSLVPLTKRVGPPLKAGSNVSTFRKKHKKTFVEKGRICAYVPRKYTDLDSLVEDMLNDKELFREKLRKISLVRQGR